MNPNPSQAPSIEKLAELLPQYGIESFIAQGGMGAVYKGRQLSLDRDVAIKVLLNEFAENEAFKNAFTTEAKAMACLNHPNLLGVFDYGNVDGMPYIVMEYVRGGSLHEAAWNKAIEPVQAVAITKGICNGLAHAHQHGIVHRDIKPANILLTMDAEPKVTDFGLAHVMDSGNSGLAMGTPGFTAPEVFNDHSQAGPLAEVYSVGVIFHQLLTGIDHTGCMTPPTHASGKIQLDAIWRKATHINPSQRYSSIAEMVADLERWSESKLVTTAVTTTTNASSHAQNIYSPQRIAHTKASSSNVGKFLIVVILLAALGFTFHLIQKKKQVEAPMYSNFVEHKDITEVEMIPEPSPKVEPTPYPSPDPIVNTPSTELPTEVVETETETADTNPKPSPKPNPKTVGNENDMNSVAPPVVKTQPKENKELADEDLELLERAAGFIRKEHEKRINELAKNGSTQRDKIDSTYFTEIEKIRSAYVTRLEKAAKETTDAESKQRLQAQAKRAEDRDKWIALLAPELKEPPAQGAATVIGKWYQTSEGKTDQWIAHEDGRMEIVGKPWKVKWRLEGETLIVDWNKIRPYVYTRDGDGWSGKSTFHKPSTLKRGD